MIDPPKTRAEAEAYRYGKWAGQPLGRRYDQQCCAYQISAPLSWVRMMQCGNKPGKGPGDLYCGIHANKVARDLRRAQMREQWRAAGPEEKTAP